MFSLAPSPNPSKSVSVRQGSPSQQPLLTFVQEDVLLRTIRDLVLRSTPCHVPGGGQLQWYVGFKITSRTLFVDGIILGSSHSSAKQSVAVALGHRSDTRLGVTSISNGCKKLIEVLCYGLAVTESPF